jgi:hypothetical protein
LKNKFAERLNIMPIDLTIESTIEVGAHFLVDIYCLSPGQKKSLPLPFLLSHRLNSVVSVFSASCLVKFFGMTISLF